jgi:hypothetical protein
MRRETVEFCWRMLERRLDESPTDWCARVVSFPPRRYPTSMPGPYDPERHPFWREVLDWVAAPEKMEIVVWKCSQAGGTESVLQNAARWAAVNQPQPMLWVSAQQELLENFWTERILPGLTECGTEIAAALMGWSNVAQAFHAPNGASLYGIWSSSRGGVKSKSYGLVFADEVSTYESFTMEKLRPRVTNFPASKIFIMSAIDKKRVGSTVSDPLFIEWAGTDRREYMFPDPGAAGKLFQYRMGWRADKGEAESGVKWAREARREDGSWDLARVAETAHFQTPSGAIITEADRVKMLDSGKWVATAEGRPGAVGYRVPCFILRQKSFGETAISFLRAKSAGKDSLRTFILEELAEEWHEERLTIGDTIVDSCTADYQTGELMSKSRTFEPFYIGQTPLVMVTGDVQKQSLYFLAREWMEDGSSGLAYWEEILEWGMFDELSQKYNASRSFIDAGYRLRRGEVFEYAINYPRIVPCIGKDARMQQVMKVSMINPYEGTAKQGRGSKLGVIAWDTWAIKWHLFQLIMGRGNYPAWRIPKDIHRAYVLQLTAEEFVDGKIVERRAGADNHLLDCEAMQIVGALWEKRLSPFGSNFKLPDDKEVNNPRQMRLDGV